jgi:uncharacterized membrane protein YkoI
MKRLFILLLLLTPVFADDKGERGVRRSYQTGKILSLQEVQAMVKDKLPGDIVETEVETEDGMTIYEFKIINKNGRRYDVYVDASNGEIIRMKRK